MQADHRREIREMQQKHSREITDKDTRHKQEKMCIRDRLKPVDYLFISHYYK